MFGFTVSFTESHATTIKKSNKATQPVDVPFQIRINVDRALSSTRATDGAMTVLIEGGKAPYSVYWSTGSTESFINGLAPGNYSVIVKDASGKSLSATSQIAQFNCGTSQCQYRTQTQGGWGSNPSGNNPGVYVQNNFSNAFPNGLVVGCTNTLTLTSALAVRNFLPSGSTPSALPSGNMTNPGSGYNNVLAGQVVALTLSVTFDMYDASFATPAGNLKDLTIASGTFAGWTVQQALNEANKALGGCATSYSLSQLNSVISSINESFVDGTINTGFLNCQNSSYNLNVNAIKTNEKCFQACDGTASVSYGGGIAPYSILWSNNSTSQNLTGLCPGTYTVHVEDNLGCAGMSSVNIAAANRMIVSASSTDITCLGSQNGTASVSASGGAGSFSYSWNPGGSTSTQLTGLLAGSYTVTVTDANNCTATASTQVNDGSNIQISVLSDADETCPGSRDGSAYVSASGGTSPYTYTWTPNVSNTSSASNLSEGMYTVRVQDNAGCSASTQIYIGLQEPYCGQAENLNRKSQINENTRLYPNPANTVINLSNAAFKGSAMELEISDLSGKLLRKMSWTESESSSLSINIENLSKGVYFIKLQFNNKVETIRFNKE